MIQFDIKLPLTSKSEGTCIINGTPYKIGVTKYCNRCYIMCPSGHSAFCDQLYLTAPKFFSNKMNTFLKSFKCICTGSFCFPEFRYLKDLNKFIKYINNYYSEI